MTMSSVEVQCVDENGTPIDWYILYKLPKASGANHTHLPLLDLGLEYVSVDAKRSRFGWRQSSRPIGDTRSVAGRTLAPLYDKNKQKELLYVMYNDEHPDGKTSITAGHTKGVVVFGKDTGFWLVHSVPKYPPEAATGTYAYPHTGQHYGQSFLCISLRTKESAGSIGQQLLFNRPYVYDYNLPQFARSDANFKNLRAVAMGKHMNKPLYHTAAFSSMKSTKFLSLAKTTNFGKDLYAVLVAPVLRSSLLVETWPNGPGKLNSSCNEGPFQVINIDSLDFPALHPEVNFTTKHDHSKWAVSPDPQAHHVCVGDINRMATQKRRAGGTVCFQHLGT